MAVLTAGFEMGVNGNNVTAADAGDATAWDVVTVSGASTIKYSNTHVQGTSTLAGLWTPTGSAQCSAEWTTALGTVTNHYGRFYLYATANPGVHAYVLFANAAAAAWGAAIRVNSDGKLSLVDVVPSIVSTSTNAISLNQWVRLEYHFIHSTTVGQMEVKIFNSAESTSPTETLTTAANRNTGANAGRLVHGVFGGLPNFTHWRDAIVGNATSYPGPVVVPSTAYQPGFRFGFR